VSQTGATRLDEYALSDHDALAREDKDLPNLGLPIRTSSTKDSPTEDSSSDRPPNKSSAKLTDLPEELLERIFKDVLSDLHIYSLTSNQFRRIVLPLPTFDARDFSNSQRSRRMCLIKIQVKAWLLIRKWRPRLDRQ
jgi:hypothetical protein